MSSRFLPLMVAGGAAVAGAALLTYASVASVVDGAFDGGVRGWKTSRTVPAGCEPPLLSVDVGEDTTTAAILGDRRTELNPGCDPSYIFQDFECGDPNQTGDFCTLSFDATLWLVADERAAVVLLSNGQLAAREIPGDRAGRTGRYAVSAAAGGAVRVVFVLWHVPGVQAGTRSVLRIDNVDSYITREDISSDALAPVLEDELPFDVESIDGHLLQTGVGVRDCNGNGVPDTYEISQGVAADRDGDGRPDDCLEKQRQIDWVLIGLAVLILTVTLVRLVQKNRARST